LQRPRTGHEAALAAPRGATLPGIATTAPQPAGEPANVELVRSSYRLYEEGRFEEWIDCFTGDAEIPALALVGSESVYRGADGLRRWLEELRTSGTRVRSYDDEYVEVDERRVVVLGRVVVEHVAERGFGSVAGWVYVVEDGRIAHVDVYPHPGLALQAVGMAPAG
jgi:ketosteroid isomerase-like protein